MNEKRRPSTPEEARLWAQLAQVAFLGGLASKSSWSPNEFAFHGGTSLHLSWMSPRFSEYLDFLSSASSADIGAAAKISAREVQERFLTLDPRFVIELRDRTKNADRMQWYELVVSHPARIGNSMVKVEFWKTSSSYIEAYPTELRTPRAGPENLVTRVSNPLPAASLETAYADKLTAFATRPFLKWRDVYDLWWIATQSSAQLNIAQVAEQFLHNVSAYQTRDGLAPADALRQFLLNDRVQIAAKADPDLRRWLPDQLWNTLAPKGVMQMVDYVFYALDEVAACLEDGQSDASLHRVRQR